MHELLAPIYYAVDYDSLLSAPTGDGDSDDLDHASLVEMCDRAWVSADAYALFSAVMAGAGRWYEWRENPAVSSSTGLGGGAGGSVSSSAASTPTSSAFASHVSMNVAEGQVNPANYVAPIVQTCGRIQSILLKSVDPVLAQALQSSGIEPQIYGMYVTFVS
jgi:TBC1 domain family member 5